MTTPEHLLSLLRAQRDLLLRLQTLAREERTCLLHNQISRLEAISEEQIRLLDEQNTFSRRLSRYLDRLGRAYAAPQPVTLQSLIAYIPMPLAGDIHTIFEELTALTVNLQRESRINWHLAQQGLHYLDYTMRLIGRATEGPLPYSPAPRGRTRPALHARVDSSA